MSWFPPRVFVRSFVLAGLGLGLGSSTGCTSGVADSSIFNECIPRIAYDCTCPGGATGLAWCLDDGTVEACRCDGTMPDYTDAGAIDGGVIDASMPMPMPMPMPGDGDAGAADAAAP